MAIALVSAGAVSANTSTSITPAFGATTTANNLLIACVADNNGIGLPGSITTSSTGWLVAQDNATAVIFYKPNCGAGESAPTFSDASSGSFMAAVLAEFSGAATSSPVDQVGVLSAGSSPAVIKCASADSTTSDLAVVCVHETGSKSHTATFSESWTPTGGTAGSLGNNGSTKQGNHINAVYYLLAGHGGGSADTDTETFTASTGIPNEICAIASFKPPSGHQPRNPAININDPAFL